MFCLFCYLFRSSNKKSDAFVTNGFSNWKKKNRLQTHVGNHSSVHNIAKRACEALMNQEQHVETSFFKHSNKIRQEYRRLLQIAVQNIRFILRTGLPFRGHDESQNSRNWGNYLELWRHLTFYGEE